MQWAAPEYGWFLLLLIPAYVIALRQERLRRRNLQQLGFRDGCLAVQPGPFQTCCLAVFFLLLVAALCRPQWGETSVQQELRGLDIIVALDTSRSMLADDVLPSRLGAAKQAISALAGRLQGDRIGLAAFAGSAFLVCPLTSDYSAFRQVLDETGSDTIPKGGTDLSSIHKEALNGFSGTAVRSRLLIIVSDGEDHGGAAAAAAAQIRENGIVVCSVTAGSAAGGIIPLPGGDFLRDRSGNIVRSRANSETLELFSPRNVRLEPSGDSLVRLYEQVRPQLLQSTVKNGRRSLSERFQLPLAAALALLLLETLICGRRRI